MDAFLCLNGYAIQGVFTIQVYLYLTESADIYGNLALNKNYCMVFVGSIVLLIEGDDFMALLENRDDYAIQALNKYADMVRRICFLYLHNSSDVEDVFQEVFIKLLLNNTSFDNDSHEKAWVIRVTINTCKDLLKSFWRKRTVIVDDIDYPFAEPVEYELMEVVLSLPPKYKDVIYLHYYEDMSVPQMASLLKMNENTIYSHLHRAKVLLKQKLEGKEYEYYF